MQFSLGRGIMFAEAGRKVTPPSLSEFYLTRASDGASARICELAMQDIRLLAEVRVVRTHEGGPPAAVAAYRLEEVIVSGFSQTFGREEPPKGESISLNYGRIEVTSLDALGQPAGSVRYDLDTAERDAQRRPG